MKVETKRVVRKRWAVEEFHHYGRGDRRSFEINNLTVRNLRSEAIDAYETYPGQYDSDRCNGWARLVKVYVEVDE